MANPNIGVWTNPGPPTTEVQDIVNQVRLNVNQQTRNNFPNLVATVYIRQMLIGGTNYLVKVYHPGDNNYVHLQINQMVVADGLPVRLLGVQENHAWDDPLNTFV